MATFTRFRSRAQRIQSEQTAALAEQLQLCLGNLAIPQPALRAVLGAIRRQQIPASNDRPAFVMITSQQYNAVADWLEEHSKRPRIALRLWRKVFDHLDPDGSGRIVLSRNQLAELLGVSPRKITEIMSELAGEPLHAIIKQAERVDGGEGRGVTYYMNPFVGEFMRRRTKEEISHSAA